ncbi:MAG TPA: DUF4097 family beta strand repeat-containing protein [Candidatus Koribacter sp.]|jgi:DUF4097 and DUF4098 domain-containing protein YvlB
MKRIALFTILCFASLAFASSDGQFTKDFTVSGTVDLEVSTGSGDVHVRPGTGNTVHIVGRIHVSSWGSHDDDKVRQLEQNPPVAQMGSLIKIGKVNDPELLRHVSISYDITAPATTRIAANSGSGEIDIQGFQGRLSADTGSGDVSLRDIQGEVRSHTGSGRISAQNVGAPFTGSTGSGDLEVSLNSQGDIDVHTGSGTIRVENAKGGLRARTGSGDVRADGTPASNWYVQTGSGTVTLRLADATNFDVEASTGSGDLHLAKPVTVQGKLSKHEIHGKVGNGGPKVEVHTGSGNIEID